MIQTVYASELPVDERLLVQKNRIVGLGVAHEGRGRRICVVTGVHGDELEGQYVAFALNQRLSEHPEQLSGTIDIYPAINPLGINSIERSVPMFDVDLNRTFPGDPTGDVTETLAAAVIDDLTDADVVIDIHASNIFLREMPQIRINEVSAEELLPLAPYLNVDYVWVHASSTVLKSTLAYSLNERGTRTLVVEAGVGMRITREYGERLVEGCSGWPRIWGCGAAPTAAGARPS